METRKEVNPTLTMAELVVKTLGCTAVDLIGKRAVEEG